MSFTLAIALAPLALAIFAAAGRRHRHRPPALTEREVVETARPRGSVDDVLPL